jgi:hypothetical protein
MTAPAILPDGHYCPACGYDQRGLTSDRCPECGLFIDKTRSSFILWERRKTAGYFKSFLRTLITASINPKRIARATSSPVDVRSARLFRRLVIVTAAIPLLLVFFLAIWNQRGTAFFTPFDNSPLGSIIGNYFDSNGEPVLLWTAGATFWPILPLAVVLALVLSSDIAHRFYVGNVEPQRQNRAMAVSYYLCAPLVWIFVPLSILVLILILAPRDGSAFPPFLDTLLNYGIDVCDITFAIIGIALLNNLRLLRLATHCGIGRWLIGSLGILVQWILATAFSFAIFPSLVGLLWLMFDSLRTK